MKNFSSLIFVLPILGFLAVSCSTENPAMDGPLVDYPNSELLLSPTELDSIRDAANLVIIDARAALTDSVIPGAVHFAATQRLVDPNHPVSGYLVGQNEFQTMMREIGLGIGDRAVIYDDGNALSAARLFYALETYGFDDAALLNGGLAGWVEAGLPLVDAPATPTSGNFLARFSEANVCTFDYVVEASGASDKVIFDVRSAEEYSGEVERAVQNGHIPNAVNLEWSEVIAESGVPWFLPAAEIQQMYDSMGITRDKEIIPHCQSNVRGSHAYFTLRLMGYDSVRPYEGSWAEYGNREDAVVE